MQDQLDTRRTKLLELVEHLHQLPTSAHSVEIDQAASALAQSAARLGEVERVIEALEKELSQREACYRPYKQLKQQIQDWLVTIEGQLHQLAPVSLIIQQTELQLVELEPLLNDWQAYKAQLNTLRQFGMSYQATLPHTGGDKIPFGKLAAGIVLVLVDLHL